jgi:glycosyltransferase involved in cell wall biosynthesis
MSITGSSDSIVPVVSVVIPLYNKGKYIERALFSVLNQTLSSYEIIVVDDGSHDDGCEKVNRLVSSNRNIRLLKQKNSGPGAARNKGLAAATGKYIAFLDADDEWLPSFLEKAIAMLEDKAVNATVVFTGFYYSPGMRRNDTGQFGELNSVIELSYESDVSFVRKLLAFHWTCSAIMQTAVLRRWGGFFDKYKCPYGEDVYVFLKLMFNERIGIIREPLAVYHTEASNLYGGGALRVSTRVPPPYLQDPHEVLESCPESKRNLLKRNLATEAINLAALFAKLGWKKDAQDLLSRFIGDGYPHIKGTLWARILVTFAPLLPTARRIRRMFRIMA